MALFQKRPQVTSSLPLYTLGAEKTLLIVGLGNPGKQYEKSRHNIGFMCVDNFADEHDFPTFTAKKELRGTISVAHMGETRIILCKPTTFMNKSGQAVQAISNYYKLTPEEIIVVQDDLDINFGSIRARLGGSDGGHNGIKSIVAAIGENFGRVRTGVGPKQPEAIDSSDFVLAPFTKPEQAQLPNIIKECNALLTEAIFGSGDLPTETRNALV